MNGGADIRPLEYLADLYLSSGRNIARVTAPGRTLSFYGGHAIVRDLRDVLWALLQPDVVIQPTTRYWEFIPQWIQQLKDPKQGGREAYEVEARIVLPAGWHVGLPPDYALYNDADQPPVPYGWAIPPPPPPSSPEAQCACCAKLLTPDQLKRRRRCCSPPCTAELAARDPKPALPAVPCAWCGEAFPPHWEKTRAGEPYLTHYCGRACAQRAIGAAQRVNAAHRAETSKAKKQRTSKAPPTPCARCGALFTPYRSQDGYTKYCGRACASAVGLEKMRAAKAAQAAAP